MVGRWWSTKQRLEREMMRSERQKRQESLLVCGAVFLAQTLMVLFGVMSPAHAETPLGFTYQGRLIDPTTSQPMTGAIDLTFGIYDSSGNCLLYEESRSGVTLGSEGLFSVSVGSELSDSRRVSGRDPGLMMREVFSNGAPFASHGQCSGGYTPVAGDRRVLRVTVSTGGMSETLSPDQVIESVPSAWVAETLQGKGPESFLQVEGALTQASAVSLTSGGDAEGLHHHDARYDAKYLSKSSGATQTITSGMTVGGPISFPA
ncbi:MAG: hypothetical protein RJB38_1125, partial [Pseudomonadota bacterium]